MIEITELNIYPVKSLRGISLQSTVLGVQGLEFDRQWMITDSDYNFLTQRQLPQMAQISVKLSRDELIFEHSKHPSFKLCLKVHVGAEVRATVWKDLCSAIDEGTEVGKWLSSILGSDVKLVRFSDKHQRAVEPDFLRGENAHTMFADGYPFLIVSEESLESLNETIGKNGGSPVPMTRFRPNIVIKGIEAFGEDRLGSLTESEGAYKFGIRKPCQRCKITTVDQRSGLIEEPKEPLRTLAQMKTQGKMNGAFFGQNSTLLAGVGQTIRVGDRLTSQAKS